jgi:hypothetical protein
MLAWRIRVKNTYTGPRDTVHLPPEVTSADELELECEEHHPGHHHHGHHRDGGTQDQAVTSKRAD